ncbi:MAG: hypothetical protein WC406_07715 [Methanoregula sp.]
MATRALPRSDADVCFSSLPALPVHRRAHCLVNVTGHGAEWSSPRGVPDEFSIIRSCTMSVFLRDEGGVFLCGEISLHSFNEVS